MTHVILNKVAVIGAGTMGSGIALALFRDGFSVNLCDVNASILRKGLDLITTKTRKKEDLARLESFSEIPKAVADVDVVIEAVFENLELKQSIFQMLDQHAKPGTLLATNTSSLSIGQIAESTRRPADVIGIHFFNPAYLMKLIEIIPGGKTSDETLKRAISFVGTLNRKIGIVAKDSPGFIFNRILVPMMNEAFYWLGEFPENAVEIDAAVTKHGVLPMGPFELADLIGLDIIYSVSEVIYKGLGCDPAYTPPLKLKEVVDNERFGIKNMRGVYDYQKNDLGNPVIAGTREPVAGFQCDGMSIFAVCINESLKVLETKVAASREDVNRAIQIGGSWTAGPFDLLGKFTAETIRQTLNDRFEKSHRQARYKICESLKSA